MSLNIIAVIPARYEASRFPAKLMQDLCGKPVIIRTYEATVATGLFNRVLVATDSALIYNEVLAHGGQAVMSTKQHDCGSDRIAEAVEHIAVDLVINVQGDEPFTNKEDLEKLIAVFKNDAQHKIALASLMHLLHTQEDIENPNHVKVITNLAGNALYFSRSVIPYQRDTVVHTPVYKHIGIYAFRKEALLQFYRTPATPLELTEKIECIRYLEHGHSINMVITNRVSIGIDTQADLEKARLQWKLKEA